MPVGRIDVECRDADEHGDGQYFDEHHRGVELCALSDTDNQQPHQDQDDGGGGQVDESARAGDLVSISGSAMPIAESALFKVARPALATAATDTLYSSSRIQPIIQATISPNAT